MIDTCVLRPVLSLAQCKPFRVKGAASRYEDITACAIKKDSKLIWSEPLAGVFRAGAAATRHILPSAKIDVVVFLPANFCRYSQARSGFVVGTENLYPVFRATEMKTNFVGVLENFLFPNHALRAGARRSDNSEGRTGRRLAIGAMQAMTGFWRPDVHLHS